MSYLEGLITEALLQDDLSAAIAEPVIEDKNKRVKDRCSFIPIRLSVVCTEHTRTVLYNCVRRRIFIKHRWCPSI